MTKIFAIALPYLAVLLVTAILARYKEMTSHRFFMYLFGFFQVAVFFCSIILFGYLGVELSKIAFLIWLGSQVPVVLLCFSYLIRRLNWPYH